MQLFLNDQLADLTDDSPIALTFQINNLAEVKNQQGNTSNQFKLPLTQRNRQILGYPDDVAFTTDLPYKRYTAKVVQNGLEIIPYGFAELSSVDDSTASITVLSGNVDFFDAIDGSIYDMGDHTTTWGKSKPWEKHDHAWSVDNVVGSQYKSEGWIWPVIDYGNLKFEENKPFEVNVKYLRPAFFLKTAVDIITRNAGFRPAGSLLQDELYNKLIVPFANDDFEHGTDHQTLRDYNTISVSNSTPLTAGRRSGYNNYSGRFPLNRVNDYPPHSNTPPNKPFVAGSYAYQALQRCSVSVSFTFDVFINSKQKPAKGGGIEMRLMTLDTQNGQPIQITNLLVNFDKPIDGVGQYTEERKDQKLTADMELLQGQVIFIDYDVKNAGETLVTVYAGATLSVVSKTKNILYGQMVQCERIFPDINQKDLLKDTLQRFGIICQTDAERKVVNFASFRDIVNNIPRARDWTSKCLNQGKSIGFKLGSYAQVNYLKHKEDDAIQPKTFGQAQIDIQDKTLPAMATLFESQFAPSFNRPYLGGSVAMITKVDTTSDSDDFAISTQPRLLVDQKLDLRKLTVNGKQPKVTFKDDDGRSREINDIISVPYFYKPDGQHNLCWADMPGSSSASLKGMKSTYYPELERMLHQAKKVVRWFMLTPRDILELDLLIPVYLQQDGAYYYINKIDAWRKGQPVKVELVKLG